MEALETRKFDAIVGTPETYWLDFKQSCYEIMPDKPLTLSDSGRGELCKDVAEFANNEGGVILLGVKEIKSPTTGLSVADKIKKIAVSVIDLQHYKHVLMAQVYPLINGIDMRWFADEKGDGLLAIIVPKSKIGLHILRQSYDESGKKIRGLEIPVRIDDQTYWYTAEQLSERINKQLASKLVDTSVKRPSSFTTDPNIIVRAHENWQKQREKRIREARDIREQFLAMNDWLDSPVLSLQVIPDAGKERLDDFYDSIKNAFAYTKPVRNMGFNLNSFGRETDTVDGAFVKAGIRECAIRLDPNGMLTMALIASSGFLGWSVNGTSNTTDFLKINSIVLIETIFEFTKFAEEVLQPAGLTAWQYDINIRNFKKNKVALYSGRPGWAFDGDLHQASKDQYEKLIPTGQDYRTTTYQILVEIYAFFALPESAIPYVTDKKITKESIVSIDASGR